MPVQQGVGRLHGPRSEFQGSGDRSAGSVGIGSLRYFVERQEYSLGREIAQRTVMGVERNLRVEALRIDIRIERERTAGPGESKLAAGEREPLVRHRVVGDIGAIETNCLTIEEVGDRLVGRCGIA